MPAERPVTAATPARGVTLSAGIGAQQHPLQVEALRRHGLGRDRLVQGGIELLPHRVDDLEPRGAGEAGPGHFIGCDDLAQPFDQYGAHDSPLSHHNVI